MGYTMLDLIGRFIEIEQQGHAFYYGIYQNAALDQRVRIASKVFADEEKRHVKVYNELKGIIDESAVASDIEIDFDVYDKASGLLSKFISRFKAPDVRTVRELMQVALDFETENLALALTVQGLMVKTEEDRMKKSYQMMSEIIHEEQEHIENIKVFLK